MKIQALIAALLCLALLGCAVPGETTQTVDTTAWLNMGLDYPVSDCLPEGNGQSAKVILLLGQSNATGCSLTSYLQQEVSEEKYAEFAAGYPNVQINFCLDDHKYTTCGGFIPTALDCGAGEGYFGPELGMAEVLSAAYPQEQIFILKYTMSGYSLHHHWLCAGQRGSIYEACMGFVNTYLEYLTSRGYDAKVSAVCWMQGESDTTDFKASHYLANQTAFAAYLRQDLHQFAAEGGIYFIDAGISSSPYCLPAYPAINEAKVQFSALSPLNLYFSTIDAGFTTLNEPLENPDLGHYDALCELELGRMFGQLILQAEQLRR
jgi:hypothetical protein